MDYYVVYRNGTSVGKTTDTEKVFPDMAYGVEYSFTVRAHNLNGLGEVAGPLPVQKVEVPGAPVLNATISMNDILLTWTVASDGGSDITNYSILGSSQNDPEWVELGRTDVTEFRVEGPEMDVLYHFKVSAENLIGTGPFSNEVSIKFTTPPGAPVLFLAVYVDNQLMIRWDAPEDDGGDAIDHYQVFLDGVIYDNTSMDFMSIPGGQELIGIQVSVRAHNAIGYGPMSQALTTSEQATSAPSAPQGLTVSNNYNWVTLSWMQPLNLGNGSEIRYSIWRWETKYPRTALGDVYGTSFTDTSVLVNRSYYYQVYSVNEHGLGGSATIGPCSVKECTVEGWVVGENGDPFVHAKIYLYSEKSGYLAFSETITDKEGHYVALAIPGNVTIVAVGFTDQASSVKIDLMEGLNVAGNITLSTDVPGNGIDESIWWLLGIISISVLIVGSAVILSRRKH